MIKNIFMEDPVICPAFKVNVIFNMYTTNPGRASVGDWRYLPGPFSGNVKAHRLEFEFKEDADAFIEAWNAQTINRTTFWWDVYMPKGRMFIVYWHEKINDPCLREEIIPD